MRLLPRMQNDYHQKMHNVSSYPLFFDGYSLNFYFIVETSRNFKIRVVEKLSEFQRAVGSAPETNVIGMALELKFVP